MSKVLRIASFTAYTLLFAHYLIYSFSSNNEEIELDYNAFVRNINLNKVMKRIRANITYRETHYQFVKPKRFPTDYKYILKYRNQFYHPGVNLEMNGQEKFITNNCKYINCYFTDNAYLLPDIRHFDAILLDVEEGWNDELTERDPSQKYIFVASESAARFPLCDPIFNNYYNVTWTYKLDSDIPWTFLNVFDLKGNIVGPKKKMSWIKPMMSTPSEVKSKLSQKKVAVAYFITDCNNVQSNEHVTNVIIKELKKYGLALDTFGWCGNKTCPQNQFIECLKLLETDYYFYLSFEDSFSEDFVTYSVLYPLQHYAVPIVYGGADYSRFLPPGSYIDATILNATQIAEEVFKAIRIHSVYIDYFKWHNHYVYKSSVKYPDICRLCQMLNEEADRQYSYSDFLSWWNGDDLSICYRKSQTTPAETVETVLNRNTLSGDGQTLNLNVQSGPDYVNMGTLIKNT